MTLLADILPLRAISPGLLQARLERARPDLMAWSRSGGSASLPPGKLVQALIGALPAAFCVHVEELAAQARRSNGQKPFALQLVNRPSIEIWTAQGEWSWTVGLCALLRLSPAEADIWRGEQAIRLAGPTGADVEVVAAPVSIRLPAHLLG